MKGGATPGKTNMSYSTGVCSDVSECCSCSEVREGITREKRWHSVSSRCWNPHCTDVKTEAPRV